MLRFSRFVYLDRASLPGQSPLPGSKFIPFSPSPPYHRSKGTPTIGCFSPILHLTFSVVKRHRISHFSKVSGPSPFSFSVSPLAPLPLPARPHSSDPWHPPPRAPLEMIEISLPLMVLILKVALLLFSFFFPSADPLSCLCPRPLLYQPFSSVKPL